MTADATSRQGVIALFGGAAGCGKSTVAALWCESKKHAVHLQLDEIRGLIVSGRADPQENSDKQASQYWLSVRACCILARVFVEAGYDVAIDDVFEPQAFLSGWKPYLEGLEWRIVILHPTMDEVLRRGSNRKKRVRGEIVGAQYKAVARWPESHRVNTTGLTPHESLARVCEVLKLPPPEVTDTSGGGDGGDYQ